MKPLYMTVFIFLLASGSLNAGAGGVTNIADTLHPNIHQNVGEGANANPNGANDGGGNLHGIANVPGQSDAQPAEGAPGFADQLGTVHGGISAVNQNSN